MWMTVGVIGLIVGVGYGVDLLWRRRRVGLLEQVSLEDFVAMCPAGMENQAWVESRNALASCLGLPPDVLNPRATVADLERHFALAGVSSVDVGAVVEELGVPMQPVDPSKETRIADVLQGLASLHKERPS